MTYMDHWRISVAILCACLLAMTANAQQQTLDDLNAEVVRLCQQGQYSPAIEVGKKALAMAEKTLGPDHPDVAISLNNLKGLYREQGQYAQAEPLFKRALAIDEKALGPDHPDVATGLNNLAGLYCEQGHYAQAEPLFKRALAIREKALGPDHPLVAASLNNLALLYYTQGQYAQAEPLYRRALTIAEKALGSDHPDVATGLNNLALLYETQGQYSQAEPLYKRALVIAEKALGPDHPDMARSLNNLAGLYKTQGQYAQAEALYKRALAIAEKALGPDHPDVATSLNNLADLYKTQGQYTQAEPLYKRALAIREKALGLDHPDMARSLNNLADLYDNQGQYAQAEPLYRRALAIAEKALGSDHPLVATILNNLAGLYCEQGQYAQAEALYKRALAIAEKVLGPDHPDVATSLNNLALLYKTQGQYAHVEPLYKRALAIKEKALGPDHPLVATSLNNLAELYRAQGQYAQAELLYNRALAIYEKALGPDHPDVAASLNNLAALYCTQGQYTQAEPLYKRALAIREKALGPDHPDVATSLNNLATLYYSQGHYAQVEALYKRALAIREKALSPDHPDVATSLNNLAGLYCTQGQYAQAEALYKRTLAIDEKAMGLDHPNVANDLNNLAELKSVQGRDDAALALNLRANAIHERLIDQVFSFSSEKGRFQFLNTLEGERDSFLTLCAERLGTKGTEAGLSFLLRRKGIVLDSLVEDAKAARLSEVPALRELVKQLRLTKTQLASLVLAGPGKRTPEQYQANVATLQSQVEELEKDMARQSAPFRSLLAVRKAGLPEVTAALPPGSALVEFAKYKSFNFSAKKWGTEKYIAYVLRQGVKEPVLVKLGEAESIDRLIKGYQAAIRGFVQKSTKVSDVNAASEALEQAVWEPVKAALGQAKRVYLSPDGELNFVSFAGLRDKSGRYTLEDYDLAYVSSGRDLARGKLQGDKSQKRAVLFGAPDFGGTATAPGQEMITRTGGFRSELVSVRAFGGLRFMPLPGTRVEVIGIEKLTASNGLKPEMHLGIEASEGWVKATAQPRILHFATHGFFLPESGWAKPSSGADPMTRLLGEQTVDLGKWKVENPMHRLGLALAGANVTLEGKAKAGEEDGILTAEEVAGLDLAGTELVVLSACETGLGEAKGGEGVLGLRRAFVQAGAENLVMALWSVSDKDTQEFMEAMYGKYLGGQPVWKALLDAQRDALAAERKAGREPNPFLWAAFVANGVGVQ